MTFSNSHLIRRRYAAAVFLAAILVASGRPALQQPLAAEPLAYRFTFPEPEHHWMQVEMSLTGLDSRPLELRMSRSSPGRYSIHDFAKNVYDVKATGPDGRTLAIARPDAHGWTIREHGATVHVSYKVFGDRVDGTYLAIDATHAHINMPAAIMWARGLDDRPSTLTFEPPASASGWRLATQLPPGAGPLQLNAPNLQYLMDSPVEFSAVSMREFDVDGRRIRFALHHQGTDAELDAFAGDVEKIVRQERDVFGELPAYDFGTYTFLADYLPYAGGDGMEHRNSTVLTSSASLARGRRALIGTVAHEFFHGWNVERIRPRSLEPFDFERANMSGELWLAEGFTQYYGPLAMSRAGLADFPSTLGTFAGLLNTVVPNPARRFRSAEEMSRMAVFTDGGRSNDRTNWPDTVISYYPFGGAIALGLDLSLRERSSGRVTLDTYMRELWRRSGKPGGSRPGYVERPYTIPDLQRALASISDDAFAREFFARYIQGHDVVDYAQLLKNAGLVLRQRSPEKAWWGDVRLEEQNGALRLATAPVVDTPLYEAGVDVGDEIREIDGRPASASSVAELLAAARPGARLAIVVVSRTGRPESRSVTLRADPRLEIVTAESAGGSISPAERQLREAWLGSR